MLRGAGRSPTSGTMPAPRASSAPTCRPHGPKPPPHPASPTSRSFPTSTRPSGPCCWGPLASRVDHQTFIALTFAAQSLAALRRDRARARLADRAAAGAIPPLGAGGGRALHPLGRRRLGTAAEPAADHGGPSRDPVPRPTARAPRARGRHPARSLDGVQARARGPAGAPAGGTAVAGRGGGTGHRRHPRASQSRAGRPGAAPGISRRAPPRLRQHPADGFQQFPQGPRRAAGRARPGLGRAAPYRPSGGHRLARLAQCRSRARRGRARGRGARRDPPAARTRAPRRGHRGALDRRGAGRSGFLGSPFPRAAHPPALPDADLGRPVRMGRGGGARGRCSRFPCCSPCGSSRPTAPPRPRYP